MRGVIKKTSPSCYNQGMNHSITSLILDMDGVIWRGSQVIGDLPEIFRRIADKGMKFTLVTNNATRTPQDYVERLTQLGVYVSCDQVVNSGVATAAYLSEIFPGGGDIFIVGERGLLDAMNEYGFAHSERTPLAVVAGLDRKLTYEKLSKATLLIRSGLPFIGTNPDNSIPTTRGLEPGAGSILAALEAASNASPKVIGKPNPEMYEVALKRLGSKPEETIVVGDRLETDIAGAQALGCPTALVLSGVATREQAEAWLPRPDFIVSDLTELLSRI